MVYVFRWFLNNVWDELVLLVVLLILDRNLYAYLQEGFFGQSAFCSYLCNKNSGNMKKEKQFFILQWSEMKNKLNNCGFIIMIGFFYN